MQRRLNGFKQLGSRATAIFITCLNDKSVSMKTANMIREHRLQLQIYRGILYIISWENFFRTTHVKMGHRTRHLIAWSCFGDWGRELQITLSGERDQYETESLSFVDTILCCHVVQLYHPRSWSRSRLRSGVQNAMLLQNIHIFSAIAFFAETRCVALVMVADAWGHWDAKICAYLWYL